MTRDVLSSRGQLSRVLDKRGGGAFPRDRALLSAPPNSTKRHDTPDRKLGIENVFDFPISYLLLKRILKISADFSFSVHCTLSFAIYSREIIRVKMINFREKFQIKRFPSRNETRIIYLNCPTKREQESFPYKSSPKRTNFSSSQCLLAGNFEWNGISKDCAARPVSATGFSRGVETVILHPGYAVSGRHVGQAED